MLALLAGLIQLRQRFPKQFLMDVQQSLSMAEDQI